MAKLVGIPCAVAVKQVLNGTLSEKGVLAPMNGKINGPLMKELKVCLALSFVWLFKNEILTWIVLGAIRHCLQGGDRLSNDLTLGKYKQ